MPPPGVEKVAMLFSFVLLGVALLLSGVFSGSETAFTSLSSADVERIRTTRGRGGRQVAHLTSEPQILLTTVLIGNNLVNIGASVLASSITIEIFGSGALGYTTGILTLLVLIFGEVVPKQLAISHNETVSLYTAPLILFLSIILKPVVWFIASIAEMFTRLTGGTRRATITQESILHMLKRAEATGIIEGFRSKMLKSVFRFKDLEVGAIMTHRTQVFSLDKNTTVGEAIPEVSETGYARIPIYDGDPERIVGVVLAKDLMKQVDNPDLQLKEIMIPPVFVPEQRNIQAMLTQLLQEKLNLAIVLDEYGGLAGIVTIEDIVEEIFGEIYDENETRERAKITHLGHDRYMIRADIPIHVLNDFLHSELETDRHVQTLGGYLVHVIGRIPEQGERIESPAGSFTITGIEQNRILHVQYERPPRSTKEE